MTIGPVQLLVIGFSQPTFDGRIRAQLDRLRESETIRVLDLALVHKDEEGNLEHLRMSDLSVGEAEELGALVGALIGLGAGGEAGAELGAAAGAEAGEDGHLLPDDVWYIDDVLEDAEAAAVVLIEHRWAIGLRDAVREAGGFHLSDAWVHPLDLVSIGLMEAHEVESELGSAG